MSPTLGGGSKPVSITSGTRTWVAAAPPTVVRRGESHLPLLRARVGIASMAARETRGTISRRLQESSAYLRGPQRLPTNNVSARARKTGDRPAPNGVILQSHNNGDRNRRLALIDTG